LTRNHLESGPEKKLNRMWRGLKKDLLRLNKEIKIKRIITMEEQNHL